MIKLEGPWISGFAFDVHTIESIYTGDNDAGHPTFDTKRSPMGQCLYELKYGQHLPVLKKIVDLIVGDANFLKFIAGIDVILPVPPSNKYRQVQPVLVCATKIAEQFKKVLRVDILSSTNKDELKNVETGEKYQKIKDAVKIEGSVEKSKNILVFDDVFDSGSTLSAMVEAMKEKGYTKVHVFTLTKTRKAD